VGAGDALLAGFIAIDDQREEKLARGLLWASSSVQSALTLFEVDQSIGDAITVSKDFDAAEPVAR
jgi:1-phosphofructokinase